MSDNYEAYIDKINIRYDKIKLIDESEHRVKYLVRDTETNKLFVMGILKCGDKKIYDKIIKIDNMNILKYYHVFNLKSGELIVIEEYLEGAKNLNQYIDGPINKNGFEDCLLQICDAMIYLNSLKKPILYNNIFPENILVDKDNVVKIMNFERANDKGAITDDIKSFGELINNTNDYYKKRYRSLINACHNKYGTFTEVQKGIHSSRRVIGIKYTVFIMISVILFIFLRLLWVYARLNNRILKYF